MFAFGASVSLLILSSPLGVSAIRLARLVGHKRTTHRTWFHATVRMPVAEALGQPRPEVIQKALALAADR